MLRARRARREDSVGSWLPEPIVSLDARVRPRARGAARRLRRPRAARRARDAHAGRAARLRPARHVRACRSTRSPRSSGAVAGGGPPAREPGAAPRAAARRRRPDADLARQREVVDAFLAASRAGDFEALARGARPRRRLPHRRGRGQPRSRARRSPAPPRSPSRSSRAARRFAPLARPALVNGARRRASSGPVRGRSRSPASPSSHGRIVEIDLVIDPAKLEAIALGP